MNKPQFIQAILLVSLALTGCSKVPDAKHTEPGEISQGFITESEIENRARTLTVTDTSGKPLAQATVLIGDAVSQPFASNYLSTNSAGQFIAPDAWTTPLTVTVQAPGYVRASFWAQTARGQTFQLRRAAAATKPELKGQGTGFQLKDSDNVVDFALMMPVVQKRDLFAFNINTFISPLNDTVTVYGQKMDIPSNVSVPKQKEKYGLFPVTLEKPLYRLYFDGLGMQRIATIHGTFPFKEVVGEMQAKKSFFELINYFTLKGGSLRDVSLTQPTQTQDLPINELSFNEKRSFVAPSFDSSNYLVAIALSPYQTQFLPTDLKNVPANANQSLTVAAGGSPQLVVVLLKKKDRPAVVGGQLSVALVPFASGVRPTLLPMMENPQLNGPTEVRMQVPSAPAGLTPVATYMVMSTVQKAGTADRPAEITTPLWDVYANNWQSEMRLPQWPGENLPAGLKRWEVSYLANQGANKAVDLNPGILETVTHATHSASDF